MEVIDRTEAMDQANLLSIMATASSGNAKAIKKRLRDLASKV